ncbi:hypothetical protein CLOM_g13479 [Closterium sp. NIES-68]|nr:hypothetical protein CLOM_g13479 [Closterium sp. NIES-68]
MFPYRGLGGIAPSTAAVAEAFSAAFQCASDSPDLDTDGPVRIQGARVLGPLDDYIETDNNDPADDLEPKAGEEGSRVGEEPRQQQRNGVVGSRFFGQQKSSSGDSIGKGGSLNEGIRVGQDASRPSQQRVRSVNGIITNGNACNTKLGSGNSSSSIEPVAIPRRTIKIKPLQQLQKPIPQAERAGAVGAAAAGEEGGEDAEKKRGVLVQGGGGGSVASGGGPSAVSSPPLPSIDSFAHTRRLQSLSNFKPRSRLLGRQSQEGEVGEKEGAGGAGGGGNPLGNSAGSFSSQASRQQRLQPRMVGGFRPPRRLNEPSSQKEGAGVNGLDLNAREDRSCTTAGTGASSNGDGVRAGPMGGRVEGESAAREGFRRLQRGGRGVSAGSAAAAPGVNPGGNQQVEDDIEGFRVAEGEGEGFGHAEMLTDSLPGGGMGAGGIEAEEAEGGLQGKRKRRKIVLVGSDGDDDDGNDGDYEEEEDEEKEGKQSSMFNRANDAGSGAAATTAATSDARRFFGVRGPQLAPSSSAAVQRAEKAELRARLLALHAPSTGWRSARDPGVGEEAAAGAGSRGKGGKGVGGNGARGQGRAGSGAAGGKASGGKGKGKKGGRKSGKDRWEEDDGDSDDWIVEDDIEEEIEEELEELEGLELEDEEEEEIGGRGARFGRGKQKKGEWVRRSGRARRPARYAQSEEWEGEEEWGEGGESGGGGGAGGEEKEEEAVAVTRRSVRAAARAAGKGRSEWEKWEEEEAGGGVEEEEEAEEDEEEEGEEEEEEGGREYRERKEEESDPVLEALRKCEQIAAALREKLLLSAGRKRGDEREGGRTGMLEGGYAETDESAARLISQDDVSAACGESVQLKGYQLVGVNFLLLLYRQKVGGAILADEMGLGKTVQAVVLLGLLSHLDKNPGPHLVVAPASLLDNWQRELQMWCPGLRVVLYHGAERAKIRQLYGGKRGKKGKRERRREKERKRRGEGGGGEGGEEGEGEEGGGELEFNVVLTCYSLFERDSAAQRDDRKFLRRFRFSCVLMDEAHLLKDRSSQRTSRLRQLAQAADYRLMLTGTPLQNDLQELWSLLEFLMPDIFTTHQCDISEYLGKRDQQPSKGGGAGAADEGLIGRMKAILGPFVLRRVKADVMKQLVAKVQKVELLSMEGQQAAAYSEAVEHGGGGGGDTAAVAAAAVDAMPRRQLASIFTHLRKLANHPLLVRRLFPDPAIEEMADVLHGRGVFGFECKRQRVVEELQGYSDFTLNQLCEAHNDALAHFLLSRQQFFDSCKCQALSSLLPQLQSDGHRVLLFSQWTAVLDILQHVLGLLGLKFLRLDGSTQVVQRQALVDEFNRDPSVFAMLLSTRAGGQGLNLTGADTVILHDVDFNPQMDRQAEDRCHRIGQTRPVTVMRLVTRATVDEGILNIAQRKLSLDAALLSGGGEGGTMNNRKGSEKGAGGSEEAQSMAAILSSILASKS